MALCEVGFDGLSTLALSEAELVTFSAPAPYTEVRMVVTQDRLEGDFVFVDVVPARRPELTVWRFESSFTMGMDVGPAVLTFEGFDPDGVPVTSVCEISLTG